MPTVNAVAYIIRSRCTCKHYYYYTVHSICREEYITRLWRISAMVVGCDVSIRIYTSRTGINLHSAVDKSHAFCTFYLHGPPLYAFSSGEHPTSIAHIRAQWHLISLITKQKTKRTTHTDPCASTEPTPGTLHRARVLFSVFHGRRIITHLLKSRIITVHARVMRVWFWFFFSLSLIRRRY